MRKSNVIASCGMIAALSVDLMILGAALGLGLYLSPMLGGLCLVPIGQKFGAKYQWLVWSAVSFLSFILVPEMEQNLMYLTLFGLYPILQPLFLRLPHRLVWPCKLLYFNLVFIAVEALALFLLTPEPMPPAVMVILVLVSNAVFIMYDYLLPRAHLLFRKYFGKFKR